MAGRSTIYRKLIYKLSTSLQPKQKKDSKLACGIYGLLDQRKVTLLPTASIPNHLISIKSKIPVHLEAI